MPVRKSRTKDNININKARSFRLIELQVPRLPQVLLAAPISSRKDPILREWLQYITRFTYPQYDILLVDNSDDEHFREQVWQAGFACDYVSPNGKRATHYVAESQNLLRKWFLERQYDYYFSLECDNFPPLNIIELMLSYKLDNLNVPYFLRQGKETTLGVQKSVIHHQGWRANKVMAVPDSIAAFDGRVKHYYAPSFGCSLFSRRLMERVQYRVDDRLPTAFSDSFFHMDSNRIGIKPWAHMGVLCEHRRFSWRYNTDLFKR